MAAVEGLPFEGLTAEELRFVPALRRLGIGYQSSWIPL